MINSQGPQPGVLIVRVTVTQAFKLSQIFNLWIALSLFGETGHFSLPASTGPISAAFSPQLRRTNCMGKAGRFNAGLWCQSVEFVRCKAFLLDLVLEPWRETEEEDAKFQGTTSSVWYTHHAPDQSIASAWTSCEKAHSKNDKNAFQNL